MTDQAPAPYLLTRCDRRWPFTEHPVGPFHRLEDVARYPREPHTLYKLYFQGQEIQLPAQVYP